MKTPLAVRDGEEGCCQSRWAMARDGRGLDLCGTARFGLQSCGCVQSGQAEQEETLLEDVDERG